LNLGMGAVGMVVESAEAVERRGMVPVAEYLGGSIVNSAFHGTRLDTDHIAEIAALRRAFGEASSRVSIANTKGYTGHPMGAGIEDTVVVKCLQYGIVPPVANLAEPDEELG